MDPFNAFSLACGIIQIIDFSIKVVKKCHELYKDGVSPENEEIEDMVKHLTDLHKNVDLIDQGGLDELMDLGLKCSNTAKELIAEMKKLKVSGRHRKRQVIVKTFEAMRNKRPIEDIQKRLSEYRRILDSKILVDLRKRSHLLSLQQNEGFRDLDLKVQTVITKLAESPQTFEELKALVQAENTSIKKHVTSEIQQLRRDLVHEEYCQQVLESLWYPEIRRRQETVSNAHRRTFRWIYGPDGFDKPAHLWDNIVQWLENGGGVYWINGKAGSGKSTLMKYISGDDRTARLLKAWSGAKEICTPSFFFWSAGATLEKSFEGLLRSLLYQILQQFPTLIPLPCEDQSALGPAKDGLQRLGPIAVWTEHRLRTTFQRVIGQALGLCRLCIFIDGLDEIKGDPDMMISLITTIQSADVKFVLSSRPDRSYTEAFCSFAMLRLQDLTEPDIREYVWERLGQWLHTESATDVSSVLNSIVLKAQGVFLWVELVVKSLIKGLKNNDPIEQLQRRVELTPSGINALYAKMLSNIDVAYHPEAARLFQMAGANLTQSLLNVALSLYEGFDCVPEISLQKALQWSDLTEKRIPTICAGLLEVYREDRDSAKGDGRFRYRDHYLSLPIKYTRSSEAADASFYERFVHVGFIHRTAVEFLRQSEQAQRFWRNCYQLCPSPHSTYVRALLAKVILLGFPEKPAILDAGKEKDIEVSTDLQVDDRCDDFLDEVARGFVSEIMQNVFTEERETGTAQVSLCDDVDRTLTTVFQRHQVVPPIFHWSKQRSMAPSNTKKYAQPVSWLRKSSRSSSPDSLFNPARSDSRLPSTRPVDFLGHAALWSLSCYVVKMIDLEQKHLDKEYMNYLLCCSVWALHPAHYMASSGNQRRKSLNLIADLLSRGGNPNIYVEDFFSTTPWGLFVETASYSARLDQTAFLMTTKTFFENGADVHVKSSKTDAVFGSGQESDDRPELYFRNEFSALYYIRSWMPRDTPGWETLKGIFLANGGQDSQRYTHVAFKKDSYRPCRISERQADELIAALDASRTGYPSLDPRIKQFPERVRWTSQLGKIYQEISERTGDSEIRASSDKDATSDTDTEEEFHESVTFQTVANVQDCQPIDG